VEWLTVKALSSNPHTAEKRKKKSCFIPHLTIVDILVPLNISFFSETYMSQITHARETPASPCD
jgi:hypothetical protein